MSLSVLFKYSLHFGKKEKYAFYQLSFRYGVSFKNISGESKSVTEEMTAPWTETTLPTILSRYPLENIFNADEFGLFYQCLPNKTLHLKGEKCSGGNHSKIRLTGLATGNAYGRGSRCLSLERLINQDALKALEIYRAVIVLNAIVG